MKWKKLGRVFNANKHSWWMHSHAMIPTPIMVDGKLIVYLNFCDEKGIARVGYVHLNPANPLEVLNYSTEPILSQGGEGTFDENGVIQCSVVFFNNSYYLYYAGFELGAKIRYRLLSGMARSDDAIGPFRRIKKTPILERSNDELFFRGGPFTIYENNKFKMWYVAGSSWEIIDDKSMPVYTINYIESLDGIHWPESGKVCIKIENSDEHGFGRPYVTKINGILHMFFSIRKKHIGYRLGYAISYDGDTWVRKNDLNLDISSDQNDFDSETICYSSVIEINNKIYMFYNGNDFGKTGFGVAELISND